MQSTPREREWLELIGVLISEPLTELPAERLAHQLRATFEGRACSYTAIEDGRLRAGEVWPLTEPLGGHRPLMSTMVQACMARHPLIRFFAKTHAFHPMQTVRVPVAIAGSTSLRWWKEVGGSMGCTDQLSLPLAPSRSRSACAFVVGREDAFSTSEMRLAGLLWKLLVGLDRQIRALSRSRVHVPAGEDFRLTSRELAVLGLLAEGLTAVAIGRRLGVQDRAVQKHLEHIYSKLGVRDRLSAVLRAREAGVLPTRAKPVHGNHIGAVPITDRRRRPR